MSLPSLQMQTKYPANWDNKAFTNPHSHGWTFNTLLLHATLNLLAFSITTPLPVCVLYSLYVYLPSRRSSLSSPPGTSIFSTLLTVSPQCPNLSLASLDFLLEDGPYKRILTWKLSQHDRDLHISILMTTYDKLPKRTFFNVKEFLYSHNLPCINTRFNFFFYISCLKILLISNLCTGTDSTFTPCSSSHPSYPLPYPFN